MGRVIFLTYDRLVRKGIMTMMSQIIILVIILKDPPPLLIPHRLQRRRIAIVMTRVIIFTLPRLQRRRISDYERQILILVTIASRMLKGPLHDIISTVKSCPTLSKRIGVDMKIG